MGEFLTITEVATLLGRSPKAVRHLVERGQLPYRKLGRRVLFLRAELEKFVEGLPGMRAADVQKRWCP
jgi:excisionase family DNA binding protein